jgi:glycosyltransferase involved in cell wall biosynthesis
MIARELVVTVVAFEGPDPYAQAGGLGVRVTGLTGELARLGIETHLFFLGDPALPPVECHLDNQLVLHRWGQWISTWHPGGVYEGEEGKRRDLTESLPPWLIEQVLAPALRAGRVPIVLAEDWQTADFVIRLAEQLETRGLRNEVAILWNANNTYGFDRIPWPSLAASARITAVSRFMWAMLRDRRVDSRVIPNGIPAHWLRDSEPAELAPLRTGLERHPLVLKMARWSPDKGWEQALDAIGLLRATSIPITLLARCGGPSNGGAELHGLARERGLTLHPVATAAELAGLLAETPSRLPDLLSLEFGVSGNLARGLYAGARAVIANSLAEPFGLVGLEAMAAGGLVVTSGTGEDYAMDGVNAVVLRSLDPVELANTLRRHLSSPALGFPLRHHAMETARRYVWKSVIRNHVLPAIDEVLGRTGPPSLPAGNQKPDELAPRRKPRRRDQRQEGSASWQPRRRLC